MTVKIQMDAAALKRLHEEIRRKYVTGNMFEDWAHRMYPGFVRVVTVNGKEFVVRKDEHGEFYEPLAGAPAKAEK